MAQYINLVEFADRLHQQPGQAWWPNDIRNITEYNQALRQDCYPYFFMRGVEGFLASRHSHPIYHHEGWAQSAWLAGHNFAKEFLTFHAQDFSHETAWITFFMMGYYPNLDFPSEKRCHLWWLSLFGVYARVAAHCEEFGYDFEDFLGPKRSSAPPAQGNTQMAQLYKDVATGVIGTWIGEDADGIVLKTDDGFKVFKEVRKVMPYTVRVKFTGGASSQVKLEKGKYLVGDVLLTYTSNKGPQMMSIRELDTEKEDAYDAPQIIKFIHKVTRPKAKK